jgi:predicted PurR-regulated permease PerM
MNIIIITISCIIIHALEAMHDYAVICTQTRSPSLLKVKMNKLWHKLSAAVFFVFYVTLAIILKNPFIPILAASLRGIVFWPLLNILLKRKAFSTSNHFVEKYRKGSTIFAIYILIAISCFYISIQW